jgi:hypothetical protein
VGANGDEGRAADRGPARPAASLGEGVAFVRRVLADPPNPPRWPMYPRQFKQFLRNADPAFDESRYGSIADLMRACQKDGLLRLERDRQGGLRVFASTTVPAANVPLGWARGDTAAAEVPPEVVEAEVEPVATSSPNDLAETPAAAVVDAVIDAPPAEESAAARPRRGRPRARKTAAADGKPSRRRKKAE